MTGNFSFEDDPFKVPVGPPSSSRHHPKKAGSKDSVGTASSRSSVDSHRSTRSREGGGREGLSRTPEGEGSSRRREGEGGSRRHEGEGGSRRHDGEGGNRRREGEGGTRRHGPTRSKSLDEGLVDNFANFGFEEPVFPDSYGEAPPRQRRPRGPPPPQRQLLNQNLDYGYGADCVTDDQEPTTASPQGRPRRVRRASISASAAVPQRPPQPSQEELEFGCGGDEPQLEPAAPQRPRRTRRASMYGEAGPAPAPAPVRRPVEEPRRPADRSRSCDGLDTMRPPPGRRPTRDGDCGTVASNESYGSAGSGGGAPPRVRRGKRSDSNHSTPANNWEDPGFGRFDNNNAVDYGHGEVEYDYGDHDELAPVEPQRERRRDRGNLLDDFKISGGDFGASTKSNRQIGATIGTNLLLPMAQPEKPRARQRRTSLIGAIGAVGEAVGGVADVATMGLIGGRKKTQEVVQEAPKYDPSQDMSRRNANGLLARVSTDSNW